MTGGAHSGCISARAVARRLGVSVLTVYRLAQKGGFTPGVIVRVGRRRLQFDQAGLEAWIHAGGAVDPVQSRAVRNEVQIRGAR